MTTQQAKQRLNVASDEIDLGKLFALLIDGKWIIVFTTVIFAIAGIAFSLLSTLFIKQMR